MQRASLLLLAVLLPCALLHVCRVASFLPPSNTPPQPPHSMHVHGHAYFPAKRRRHPLRLRLLLEASHFPPSPTPTPIPPRIPHSRTPPRASHARAMAITLVDEMHAHPWERYVIEQSLFISFFELSRFLKRKRPHTNHLTYIAPFDVTPPSFAYPTGTAPLSVASSPSSSLASPS